MDSEDGHDLLSISHRTEHGAPQLSDWRTFHTTYTLLFLKTKMSILKNLQECRPFIGIIYIHVFKEAIFGHCLKWTGFRGQNFKGKVFFLTKNPPLHKHIQCRYLWARHNFVCCILMYAKGIKELQKIPLTNKNKNG